MVSVAGIAPLGSRDALPAHLGGKNVEEYA
jgi:hypothetical protein